MNLRPPPVEKGKRKYRAAIQALWMTFGLTAGMLVAAVLTDVLAEIAGSIVTLWLTGSGAVLAIFTAGNVATHKVQGDE